MTRVYAAPSAYGLVPPSLCSSPGACMFSSAVGAIRSPGRAPLSPAFQSCLFLPDLSAFHPMLVSLPVALRGWLRFFFRALLCHSSCHLPCLILAATPRAYGSRSVHPLASCALFFAPICSRCAVLVPSAPPFCCLVPCLVLFLSSSQRSLDPSSPAPQACFPSTGSTTFASYSSFSV